MKIKQLLITILTLGLNILLDFLKRYNLPHNKQERANRKQEKKILKANRRKKQKGF